MNEVANRQANVHIEQGEPTTTDKIQDILDYIEQRVCNQGCLTRTDIITLKKALVNIQNHLKVQN